MQTKFHRGMRKFPLQPSQQRQRVQAAAPPVQQAESAESANYQHQRVVSAGTKELWCVLAMAAENKKKIGGKVLENNGKLGYHAMRVAGRTISVRAISNGNLYGLWPDGRSCTSTPGKQTENFLQVGDWMKIFTEREIFPPNSLNCGSPLPPSPPPSPFCILVISVQILGCLIWKSQEFHFFEERHKGFGKMYLVSLKFTKLWIILIRSFRGEEQFSSISLQAL